MLEQLFDNFQNNKFNNVATKKERHAKYISYTPQIYYCKKDLTIVPTDFLLKIHEHFKDKIFNHAGDVCKCSLSAQSQGIHHNVFYGENKNLYDSLHCYDISCKPNENILSQDITMIPYNQKEYFFNGFLIFSPYKLDKISTMNFTRYHIDYNLTLQEISILENFVMEDLLIFERYLFRQLLELHDWNYNAGASSCRDFTKVGDLPDHQEDGAKMIFHFMPKFSRKSEKDEDVEEMLPMGPILSYLQSHFKIIFEENDLFNSQNMPFYDWDRLVLRLKNSLVFNPNNRPRAFRLDQIDRIEIGRTNEISCSATGTILQTADNGINNSNKTQQVLFSTFEYPKLIHIGLAPMPNYMKSPRYQKIWKQYLKLKHLVSNKAIATYLDSKKLQIKKKELDDLKETLVGSYRKYQTVCTDSRGYYSTGIKTDIVQFAMILPMLSLHVRYHKSLQHLQSKLEYEFKDPLILQKALTHPSFKPNYGTNPDHCRNTLFNCGIRNIVYGNRKKSIKAVTRKRGIITLNKIMKLKSGVPSSGRYDYEKTNTNRQYNSRTYSNHSLSKEEQPVHSKKPFEGAGGAEDEINEGEDDNEGDPPVNYNRTITHNERLEFLGDAIIEFLTSVHLFFMFPYIEEGGLAVYRASLVQNSNLALLAKKLELEKFMLYAHGPDLCHGTDLDHALANAFEALQGALFLDGSVSITDRILSKCLFGHDHRLFDVWTNLNSHPLKVDQLNGDRHWIPKVPLLQKLTQLEGEIGVEFNHIRILARAFTLRNTGYNNLTLGHNQRLEFLGDTILQIITSEYLYKHFPFHHEGHLSLLRSCLVNNQTQCEVCHDLGLQRFVISNIQPIELTTKDKADLLESFLGALFVDQGLEHCRAVFNVCFVSRLDDFIENQGWNDPKSLLQQCCLTLRKMDGKEPDVPIYKVIECLGPSNTRRYKVGVYFRHNRLAIGWGRSKQQAEMEAAEAAIDKYQSIFPQYTQRRRK